MKTINLVLLQGYLGGDPETFVTKTGKSGVRLRVATQRGFGENKATDWHNVTVWGSGVDFIAKRAQKGSLMWVRGQIEYRQPKSDGPIYSNIVAFDAGLVDGWREDGAAPAARGADDDMPF